MYSDPELERLSQPEHRPWSFAAGIFFLLVSILGGGLAAIFVLSQADRLGFITTNQPETKIIVRNGAKQYTEEEALSAAFLATIQPSVLRIYDHEDATEPSLQDSLLTEGAFVGYGIILTSDGKAVTSNDVLQEERTYTAENWKGESQEITTIIQDDKADLSYFTFPGSGFTAVDIMTSQDTFPLQPVYVFDYRPAYLEPTLQQHMIKRQFANQLLYPDLYIWSSEQFFSKIAFTESIEFPRGAPVFKGDGALIGIFDGSNESPDIRALFERENSLLAYLSGKEIVYPYLGVHGVDLSFSPSLPVEITGGAENGFLLSSSSDGSVVAVEPGSPADEAGLKEGDIITSIDSKSITIDRSIGQALLAADMTKEIEVRVLRDGSERTFSLVLSEL